MGIDLLDITFRLEKRFGIRLHDAHWVAAFHRRQPPDATAAEVADLVVAERAHPDARPALLTEHLDRAVPCLTCSRTLYDLPRTAFCPHCGTASDRSQIWLGIRLVLGDALGVPLDKVLPDALLRRDLGAE